MTKLIIELCQNHLGDRKLFEDMIDAAAESGADIIKMQSIFSDDLTHRPRFDEGETNSDGSIKTIKRPYQAEKERLSKLDLTIDDHLFFIEKCQKLGVTPMTTIFARRRVAEIGSLPWPALSDSAGRGPEKIVKIASYDCASIPLLKDASEYFDHLIISTGATYDEEIKATAEFLIQKRKQFSFLHCVTSYPNTLEMCNLSRMDWLKSFAPQVGWSDHTLVERDGITASKVAIMLGADYIERHFTILEKDKTKDGPVSVKPEHIRELVAFRSLTKKQQQDNLNENHSDWQGTLGVPQREMTPAELLNRDYYRGRFASFINGQWIYNWKAYDQTKQ